MNASGIYSNKTQCERGDISQTRRIYFPIADGRIKLPGGDQELRTSTLVRHRPIQGDCHIDFLGESEGSLPPPHDPFPDAVNDFWCMPGNLIYRHHVEPRVKLYSPREESFPIPLRYIDVPRTTCRIWMSNKRHASMIDGMSMDQETCRIFGQVSLNLLYWKKNVQKDICSPGRRENSRHPGHITYGQES